MQKHWSCPWGVAAVVSKLGLQLSYAVKQKQEVEELGVGGRGAMCCNQASDEPTGEFLGIKCRGAPPGRTLSPSGFHFPSYFGFLGWTVRYRIPQRETEGVRMMRFRSPPLQKKLELFFSCDNSLAPGSTREVLTCRRRRLPSQSPRQTLARRLHTPIKFGRPPPPPGGMSSEIFGTSVSLLC